MKKSKRVLSISLAMAMIFGNVAFADEKMSVQTEAWVTPDVSIEYKGETLGFKDEKGNNVYPIIYNGSTYLPVRAISGLMEEPIEWEKKAKSIFIGRTISNPSKNLKKEVKEQSPYIYIIEEASKLKATRVLADLRYDIRIFYDFEPQEFKNENGITVYPLQYNYSTYLPIRAISELMGEEIVWDNENRLIKIGSNSKDEPTQQEVLRTESTTKIMAAYELASSNYNNITSAITTISIIRDDEKTILANTISQYYADATNNIKEISALVEGDALTAEEKEAAEKVYEFAVILEHYALLSENIAYMSAAGEDYSIIAEAFMRMAIATEDAMNEAVEKINVLNIDE